MTPFTMNVWALHPRHAPVSRAEKTLGGTANPNGVKFCRPYGLANACGFWLHAPVDFSVRLGEDGRAEVRGGGDYLAVEYDLVKSLVRDSDGVDVDTFATPPGGRTKFTVGEVDPNVVQVWTGLILQTPPGWCLQIRSPVNFPNLGCRVMEGFLETDWMQYDLWVNLVADAAGGWVDYRRDGGTPLAQLVPVRRETAEGDWGVGTHEMVNRDTEEANRAFEFWLQYNRRKYASGGKQVLLRGSPLTKDSTTFYKVRAEEMGKGKGGMEPTPKPSRRRGRTRKKFSNRVIPPTARPEICFVPPGTDG